MNQRRTDFIFSLPLLKMNCGNMVSDLDRVCGGRFAPRHVVAKPTKPRTFLKGCFGAGAFPGGPRLDQRRKPSQVWAK